MISALPENVISIIFVGILALHASYITFRGIIAKSKLIVLYIVLTVLLWVLIINMMFHL